VLIPKDRFREIIQDTSLFSIDLIIENSKGEILLGYRNNAPAQNSWFVPGGRVFKNETLEHAFTRTCITELSLDMLISDSTFLGVYQHFYNDSVFDSSISTHYIVMGLKLKLDIEIKSLPLEQHTNYMWWKLDELMLSEYVHQNTKDYFLKNKGLK
jgi:colanic acid biosynthesis protein WcaH